MVKLLIQATRDIVAPPRRAGEAAGGLIRREADRPKAQRVADELGRLGFKASIQPPADVLAEREAPLTMEDFWRLMASLGFVSGGPGLPTLDDSLPRRSEGNLLLVDPTIFGVLYDPAKGAKKGGFPFMAADVPAKDLALTNVEDKLGPGTIIEDFPDESLFVIQLQRQRLSAAEIWDFWWTWVGGLDASARERDPNYVPARVAQLAKGLREDERLFLENARARSEVVKRFSVL